MTRAKVVADTTIIAGDIDTAFSSRLSAWNDDGLPTRLWHGDSTLWSLEPLPELSDRLGWIDLPLQSLNEVPEWQAFAAEVHIDHVVLLGMGGSSLAPEVMHAIFGPVTGRPRLIVLDSTHPDAVTGVRDRIDPARTLFVVSSKSGSTIETMSFFHFFWDLVKQSHDDPGQHFVAITDPGSSLAMLASERGFRRTFETPSDVGGRYSALSAFGMVPAALTGVDVSALLAGVGDMGPPLAINTTTHQHPAIALGALIGESAVAGRDKLTLLSTPGLEPLVAWIEQLVAESTGKDGRGLLPVATPIEDVGPDIGDRVFVSIELAGEPAPDLSGLESKGNPVARIAVPDRLALGREFYRWEVAVAVAAIVIGVHPFDQPDVQLAKDLARKAMTAGGEIDAPAPVAPASATPEIDRWLEGISPGEYISVHAYIAPSVATSAALHAVSHALAVRTGLPVTVDYGPRFLHSTGQLHKGGPASGRFLQIIDASARVAGGAPLTVPGVGYTFDQLLAAQAAGDSAALARRSRVLRLDVDAAALQTLARLF